MPKCKSDVPDALEAACGIIKRLRIFQGTLARRDKECLPAFSSREAVVLSAVVCCERMQIFSGTHMDLKPLECRFALRRNMFIHSNVSLI